MSTLTATACRRRIVVCGIVQGVGFRPFIYGQALRYGLGGFVCNDSVGVTIEVEGESEAVERFVHAIHLAPPPLARIDRIASETLPPRGETSFVIVHSRSGAERRTLIAPDGPVCTDCLRELFDPADRRYRYPLINCTNCGPRFTIVQDVPYDRERTTMRAFPLCPACQREYDDPLDRRFHAQPNACAGCGPTVSFERWAPADRSEAPAAAPSLAGDPVTEAARALADGAILAVKGLGGYHLVCDASNAAAVARLRRRKQRQAKPFALIAPDLATVRQLCELGEDEAALLQSHARPIVLLARRLDTPLAPAIAPGHTTLGVMLPSTPLHHLLLHDFATLAPERPTVLVMTSGNQSDEPIAFRDDDARTRLAPLTEGIFSHSRPIQVRCDDSVARIGAGRTQLFRRSRGYAPEPITLGFDCPVPLLACGGQQKNSFCLGKGRQAFVSHHIGDLENLETLTAFREGVAHFQRLFDIAPGAVAYDLHPEYLSTKIALELGLPHAIGVQHHHAHIASVLAEHGVAGQVIGVAADGTGYGSDGAIWGCEIMRADLQQFERLAHLAYLPLPGGAQAVRQPWRMAATLLAHAYGDRFLDLDIPFVQRLDRRRWGTLAQMITRGLNSPPSSSLGRLFDAVAALLGLRDEASYEGQAAVELEALAEPSEQSYPFEIGDGTPALLDVGPLTHALVDDLRRGVAIPQIAGRFHRALADMLAAACVRARAQTGLERVALSGGVFQNRLLLELLVEQLRRLGFQIYLNRRVPPNDGGLSLGQLAVAAARLGSVV